MTDKSKIGDTRKAHGLTWTAEVRRYAEDIGVTWSAGPVAYKIVESWKPLGDCPFAVENVHSRTFEAAALRAIKRKAADVRKARDFLAEYDAPKNAADRETVKDF